MSGNPLLPFLDDHPWTSESLLAAIFGSGFKEMALASKTRNIAVPGVGPCYGVKREKLSSVPGVRRRERAKRTLIANYGKDVLWDGGSPGIWGADLLAAVEKERKFWIRIWVDSGAAAVEALPFLHPRPARHAPNMVDLVMTTAMERAEMIRRQILSHWDRGKDSAFIYAQREEEYLRLGTHEVSFNRRPAGKPLAAKEVKIRLAQRRCRRLENRRHAQNTGKIFLDLKEVDFDLLKYVGDNPLFSTDELATLVSHSVTGRRDSVTRPAAVRRKARHRFYALEEKGLIERALGCEPGTHAPLSSLATEEKKGEGGLFGKGADSY